MIFGAANQIWTGDLVLTKDALYRLSHSSVWRPGTGSNRRPLAWQASVLTNWTTGPFFQTLCRTFLFCVFARTLSSDGRYYTAPKPECQGLFDGNFWFFKNPLQSPGFSKGNFLQNRQHPCKFGDFPKRLLLFSAEPLLRFLIIKTQRILFSKKWLTFFDGDARINKQNLR